MSSDTIFPSRLRKAFHEGLDTRSRADLSRVEADDTQPMQCTGTRQRHIPKEANELCIELSSKL